MVAGFIKGKGVVLLIRVNDGDVPGLEPDYRTLGKRPDRDGYQQFLVILISNTLGKSACSLLTAPSTP